MRSRERESFSPLSLLLLGASFSVGIQTRKGRSGGEREKEAGDDDEAHCKHRRV